MSLDISKLQNVCGRGKKIIARCPACAESGHDNKGEHLIVNAEGRFACVVYPGDSADAREHRKRIFSLCGDRAVKPLDVRPARETECAGRLGRGIESETAVAALKSGLLGRLGREFQTHLEPSRKIERDFFLVGELCDNQKGVLPVLKSAVRPNRPLTERELWLLRRAGAENDPLIITALNLFNATIVE
jgi:hypothetical protein